jgi:hypothetical protein
MLSGPPEKVFVSHSKDDLEGQHFIQSVFDLEESRFRPTFYTIIGVKPPHAQSLRDHIRGSKALFVLLSKKMEGSWTRSWVGFEVGIAMQQGIPIIAVELENSTPVGVPVPGVTHYATRSERPRALAGTFWSAVARTACIEPPKVPRQPREGFWGPVFDFMEFISENEFAVEGRFQKSTCKHDDCKAEFFTPKDLHDSKFYCPVCRRLTWGLTVQLMELAESASAAAREEKKRLK